MLPNIFIASSLEGKDMADAIKLGLDNYGRCTVWHEAFPLSKHTVDVLLTEFAKADFVVFVFSADDRVQIRSDEFEVARDNVLFEAGMFMGMHGKERGFIVSPKDVAAFHMPTDLIGLTTSRYDLAWARREPVTAMGA
jgi:predicted nucleotide-binding protein